MKEETLGQVFKRYREAERIKVEQIEKDTKISKRMILAIENDDYNQLPDDLYTTNLIRTYAKYLSLDYNKLLNLYKRAKEKSASDKNLAAKKVKIYITPQRARNMIILLIVLILFVYLGLQINKIFQAPQLDILQPVKDLITAQNYIEIKGRTEKEARVFINEKEVFLDPQGNFSATLDLQKGLNIIKISAAKKYSKENVLYRQILVQ
ncbi:MAG: helix-turn-helix domain-containing protein [Candidatus Parcubacteria bacterium]|nr:helix-turn-helix domain-containing protein [Candidatus Parcubacteria bacterium]